MNYQDCWGDARSGDFEKVVKAIYWQEKSGNTY